MASSSALHAMRVALLVAGSFCSACSFVFSVTGVLELTLILGPVSCCQSWWSHNAALAVLWLPVLALAAYLLHSGVQDAIPFVALGSIFLVVHLMLLLAYWLRALLRKQAAKELPTQELLTEAQRVMMVSSGADVGPHTTSDQHQRSSRKKKEGKRRGTKEDQQQGATGPDAAVQPPGFHLQPGRTDGVAGFTLYIPGEQEEAVLQEVAAKHFYQKRLQQQQQQQAARESAGGALLSPQAVPVAGSGGLRHSSPGSMRGTHSPPEASAPTVVGLMGRGVAANASAGMGSLSAVSTSSTSTQLAGRGPVIQVMDSQRWSSLNNSGALRASQRLRFLQALDTSGGHGASAAPSPAGGGSVAHTPKYVHAAASGLGQQQPGVGVAPPVFMSGTLGRAQGISAGVASPERVQEEEGEGAAVTVAASDVQQVGPAAAKHTQHEKYEFLPGGSSMVEASNPLFSPQASLVHELSLRMSSGSVGASSSHHMAVSAAGAGGAQGSFTLRVHEQTGSAAPNTPPQQQVAEGATGSNLASPILTLPPAQAASAAHTPKSQQGGRVTYDSAGATTSGHGNTPAAASHRRQGSTPPAASSSGTGTWMHLGRSSQPLQHATPSTPQHAQASKDTPQDPEAVRSSAVRLLDPSHHASSSNFAADSQYIAASASPSHSNGAASAGANANVMKSGGSGTSGKRLLGLGLMAGWRSGGQQQQHAQHTRTRSWTPTAGFEGGPHALTTSLLAEEQQDSSVYGGVQGVEGPGDVEQGEAGEGVRRTVSQLSTLSQRGAS